MSGASDATIPIAAWIAATLLGDSAFSGICPGGVWEEALPQQLDTWPAAVFAFRSAADVRALGEYVMGDCAVLVKGIDKSLNPDRVTPVAARILQLLDNATGAAAGGDVWLCQRAAGASGVRYLEVSEGGPSFWHMGYVMTVLGR